MLQITGYIDRWTVPRGETVSVRVSTKSPRFYARLIRHLGAIGKSKDWPSQTMEIAGTRTGPHEGIERAIVRGSFFEAVFEGRVGAETIAIEFDLYPTSFGLDGGALLLLQFADRHLAVIHDSSGVVAVTSEGDNLPLDGAATLRLSQWQRLRLEMDLTAAHLRLMLGGSEMDGSLSHRLTSLPAAALDGFAIGAWQQDGRAVGRFSGKIASPSLFVRRRATLSEGVPAFERLAHWHFGSQAAGPFGAPDICGQLPNGRFVNAPTRAVTSSRWNGRNDDFRSAEAEYDAVWLHCDDLGDAGWDTSFEVLIPDEAEGACSILLSCHEAVDWWDRESFDAIPLFVRPENSTQRKIALVLPTFSYRAYANNTFAEEADPRIFRLKRESASKPLYDYAIHHDLLSLYSLHEDGSGVCLATMKRPQMTVRADFDSQLQGFPHQFSADLAIVGWLNRLGLPFDTLTDEMLHEEGVACLRDYDVILTGSHPEYASDGVLSAYEDFAAGGGSLIYLGGNGFYWSVGLHADIPELIEVRRFEGTRTWTAGLGERHQQLDGRSAGLWRAMGRAPNRLFGIGFCAHGFSGDGTYEIDPNCDRTRLPARLAAVASEIGDATFGVAGLELDRFAIELGSPPDAVVFARVAEMPRGYLPAIEELEGLDPLLVDAEATLHSMIEGQIVLLRHSGGGQIFSVGSIRWTDGLLDPEDRRRVGAVTEAALRDLLEDARDRRGAHAERANPGC